MTSPKSNPKKDSDPEISIHKEKKGKRLIDIYVIAKKNESADKSTMTEDKSETITIESPKDDKCLWKRGEISSDREYHIFLDNFLTLLRQKKTKCLNLSTQTDDAINLSQEDEADDEESQERSKSSQLNKEADILSDNEPFRQEFKNFLYELYTPSQRLFEESESNNKQTLIYSHNTRRHFLKVVNSAVDLITCDDNASEDVSNNATAAADIVHAVVNNNNNDRETSPTQTETTHNIIQLHLREK